MAAALTRRPSFRERVFTEQERWYCEHKSSPETHYALRFAAKEAVLKALGTGFSGMRFTDVEIVNDRSGRPTAVLHGAAKERAAELGILEMHVSLSYTHTTAVASAFALTADSVPKRADEKEDPKTKIARSFKELRAMLDDLEKDAGLDLALGAAEATPLVQEITSEVTDTVAHLAADIAADPAAGATEIVADIAAEL